MTSNKLLKDLLERVATGDVDTASALSQLVDAFRAQPFEDLGFARVDHHRGIRQGFPEVILGLGKTPDQIAAIAKEIVSRGSTLLVTRATPAAFDAVHAVVPDAIFHDIAKIIALRQQDITPGKGTIVVAGMEGALPSVVSGLVSVPVIAVPTSVGYGASFGGIAALLGMLNSCASGVSVVNIDNGFGAANVASLINHV